MIILPAIDLYGGKAVRLYKGQYEKMTVYGENPLQIARDFKKSGAENIHIVDLEGAKTGETPNYETIKRIICDCGLKAEIGGGIRDMATVRKYIEIGAERVILGTAAITDKDFLSEAVKEYGEKIAVGVDIKDGKVAIKGWTEKTDTGYSEFCREIEKKGVRTVICTDISKDGAMKGTNRELYGALKKETGLNVIASGGISDISDVMALKDMSVYGAIIGKAYYIGAIDLKEAIEVAK